MKKELTLVVAAMAAVSLQTSAAMQQNQTNEGRTETPSCIKQAAMVSAKPEKAAGWKFDVSKDDIIFTQPEGEESMYSKSCDYYLATMFGVSQSSGTDIPCRVVENENGDFYIYNPFARVDTKSWLKGTVEGDRMTIKLPQAIYTDGDGTNEYVYVAQMCYFEWEDDSHESGRYYAKEGDTEIVFNKDGDSWIMQPGEEVNEHPLIMGLVAADDGSWCIYSDWNITITKFNQELVTLPADARVEEMTMSYPVADSYIAGNTVKVGYSGSDIYLSGISPSFPDSWIKGKVTNGKWVFPSGQYLGANESANAFGIFTGASEERKYNEEYDYWYNSYTPIYSLTFEKDPQTGIYTTENCLAAANANLKAWIDMFSKPRIAEQKEIEDLTPLDPILSYYSAPGDYSGSLYFYFPILNSKGQLLDTNNLYYRIFVDDEVFVFYSDEYAGMTDGAESVPFNFSNKATLTAYGVEKTSHCFSILFTGYDSLDVQTFYLDGDKEYASNKLRVVGETDSVDSVASEMEAVAEKWYDLSGRMVQNPENGIYMKRVEYSDGSFRTFKIAVK